MPSKYKHIKLPTQLVGNAADKKFHKQGRSKDLPGFEDKAAYKERLSKSRASLRTYGNNSPRKRIDSDKKFIDFKIKVQGPIKKEMFTKYNLDVKARYDDKEIGQEYSNDTVIARMSLDRLPGQTRSEFEKFEKDLTTYIESPKDKLKTYFGNVEELEPITPDSIIDDVILEKFTDNTKLNLDVVFNDDKTNMTSKIEDMKELLDGDFLASINTELVHVCHVKVNRDQLDLIFASYGGIIEVEESLRVVFKSSVPAAMGEFEIEDNTNNKIPVMVADFPIDQSHPLLQPAFVDQFGNPYTSGGDAHGTQVAGLVSYGFKLSANGKLTLDNKVSSVSVFKPLPGDVYTLDNDVLKEALEQYKNPGDVMVLNMSINAQDYVYERKIPHWLSILVDEYAKIYNCLFVISAGNLFNENWDQTDIDRLLSAGYPAHFEDSYSMITPPADSINALSVGSVAYSETPNSISKQFEPTMITRRGLLNVPSYNFLKPDLVHYDSNYDSSFGSEDNGPFMPFPGGGIGRYSGTSFAAPLVAHDAGVLVQEYPDYSINTIKGLLIHFAKRISLEEPFNKEVGKLLVGHGIPDLEKTLYSLNTTSTIVIEDEIKVGTTKKVRIPIPSSLAGSNDKRLKIRKTLVYNPSVYTKDVSFYTPAYVTAKIVREDGHVVDKLYSSSYIEGAHKTSNVKSYKPVEMNPKEHAGQFWEIEVMSEAASPLTDGDYTQPYSIIVTLEDLYPTDTTNIHEEIQQMIEIEVGVDIEIDI